MKTLEHNDSVTLPKLQPGAFMPKKKTPSRAVIWSWGLLFVAILTIVLAVQAHHKIVANMNMHKHIDAFDSYMKVIPLFIHQDKPYRSDRFPLPPLAMLFVAPFTLLSRPDAQMAWVLCKPLFFVPIFALLLGIVRRGGGPIPPPWAIALILIVWFFPVIGDIQEGQMNLLMLLPLTAALWLAQTETLTAHIGSGLMLALAICIKVTPLAFIAYFLYRRRWTLVAAAVLGIGFWLFVIPAIFFGWRQNLTWLHQWTGLMILPYVAHDVIKFPNGESIPEFILRFTAHLPAWKSTVHGRTVNHYVNIISLPAKLAQKLGRGLLGVIAVSGMLWARRNLASFRTRRYLLEIAMVSTFMLWASERTWVPHYVTLIFALFAVGMLTTDPAATLRTRRLAAGALAVAAFLMIWTSDLAKIFGPNGRHFADCADLVLISSLALGAVIVFGRFNDRADYAVVEPVGRQAGNSLPSGGVNTG